MKHTVGPAVLLAISCAATGAQAQNLKPGLWEINSTMQSDSGEMEKSIADMQKQMAAMPPEQRQIMQEMMARQGVRMGSSGPGAIDIKVCMTREMVERNEIATPQGDCKNTYAPRSGNAMKMSFVCTDPPSSGQGQVNFLNPQAYTTKLTVNTRVNGKDEKVSMDGQAKWLASECGTIKPLGSVKK